MRRGRRNYWLFIISLLSLGLLIYLIISFSPTFQISIFIVFFTLLFLFSSSSMGDCPPILSFELIENIIIPKDVKKLNFTSGVKKENIASLTGLKWGVILKLMIKKVFTTEQAKEIGEKLGVDWSGSGRIDVEQFRMGLDVELEHGLVDPNTNVTNDDPILTGKIALAHLNEYPDYYTRLYQMEQEAETRWEQK